MSLKTLDLPSQENKMKARIIVTTVLVSVSGLHGKLNVRRKTMET